MKTYTIKSDYGEQTITFDDHSGPRDAVRAYVRGLLFDFEANLAGGDALDNLPLLVTDPDGTTTEWIATFEVTIDYDCRPVVTHDE